ncbi:MAG: hypothetical protein GX802_00125 [Clostridiales bacterium]|jgi:hypothetical protein|nr:hypothetical protein [Clostridiales bacterium]
MQLIIAIICFLVRIFLIPNPFYYIPQEVILRIGSIHLYFHPIVLNLLAEPIIVGLTYAAISALYGKGGDRITESAIYVASYALLAALIYFVTTGYISWSQSI